MQLFLIGIKFSLGNIGEIIEITEEIGGNEYV
jgi:hypothetical protein